MLDPNGVSILEQRFTLLKDVYNDNVRIVSEGKDGIIICNNSAYYWIDKNQETFQEKGTKRLIDKIKVLQVFGFRAFCINGQ